MKSDSDYFLLGNALIIVILLTACSGGIPSESNAKSVFENKRSNQIKNKILEIDSFKKTNGQKLNFEGSEAYRVEYEATVIYPKGILPECAVKNWPKKIYKKCIQAQLFGNKFKKVGQKDTISGELIFELTEKGWKGEDSKIY